MKKYYAAVVWGDNRRLTGQKVSSDKEAKIICYGMEHHSMTVINLGTRKSELMKRNRETQ